MFPSAMDRDIFHEVGVLKIQCNLTVNTSNDGTSLSLLNNLVQCLTTVIIKEIS